MNLFTRTFSKIFKSSNQQELDKIQNLILAINNKENETRSLTESDFKEKTANFKKKLKMALLILRKLFQKASLLLEKLQEGLWERDIMMFN